MREFLHVSVELSLSNVPCSYLSNLTVFMRIMIHLFYFHCFCCCRFLPTPSLVSIVATLLVKIRLWTFPLYIFMYMSQSDNIDHGSVEKNSIFSTMRSDPFKFFNKSTMPESVNLQKGTI